MAGMCFKIMRIEGDGSVKIILSDPNHECDDSFENDKNSDSSYYIGEFDSYAPDGSYGKRVNVGGIDYWFTKLNTDSYPFQFMVNWYNLYIKPNYENKIILRNSCLGEIDTKYDENRVLVDDDTIPYYYDNYFRIIKDQSPSLICQGTYTNDSYINIPSADEILFAGLIYKTSSTANYLAYPQILYNINQLYMTSTLIGIEGLSNFGSYMWDLVNTPYVNPVLSLKRDVTITKGDGTMSNPYVIE